MDLSEKEEEKFIGELAAILEHFEELKSLNTSNVEPMSGGTLNRNIFREDDSENSTNQGEGKNQFPDQKDGFLKIPNVF